MQLGQTIATMQGAGVRAFLARELYHYVDRAKFDELDMPEGCSADDLWELLGVVRNVMGVRVLSELSAGLDGGELWYVRTPEMTEALADVVGLSSETSHIARELACRPERVFALDPFIDELRAALSRDGLDADRDAVSGLVRGNRAPDSPADVLLCNALGILRDLVRCANPDACTSVARALGVSPVRDEFDAVCALRELFARLDAGVGPCACAGRRKLAMPLFRPECPGDTVLAHVVSVFMRCENRGADPLVAFVSNSDVLWQYAPFERWNGMMELVIRAAFFAHMGMPGVAFAPFCNLALRWENGELPEDEAPCRIEETQLRYALGVDVTQFYAQKVRLLARGVRELDAALTNQEKRLARLLEAPARDARLNHRQRELLVRLVENPSLQVGVRAHAEHHGVSVATARADLQKLAEFDYVYRRCPERADRAVAFAACPDLPAKLARLLRENER